MDTVTAILAIFEACLLVAMILWGFNRAAASGNKK